jgi:hypothetical protein
LLYTQNYSVYNVWTGIVFAQKLSIYQYF